MIAQKPSGAAVRQPTDYDEFGKPESLFVADAAPAD